VSCRGHPRRSFFRPYIQSWNPATGCGASSASGCLAGEFERNKTQPFHPRRDHQYWTACITDGTLQCGHMTHGFQSDHSTCSPHPSTSAGAAQPASLPNFIKEIIKIRSRHHEHTSQCDDVVGRLTPSMNGNQEFTTPRSLMSQAGHVKVIHLGRASLPNVFQQLKGSPCQRMS
jgi:hypothetical protein